MPIVHLRAADAICRFFALLVMELAQGGATCTLYCPSLLHTCGLPRLLVCASDEASESNLRLGKHCARVTSTVPNDNIRQRRTPNLLMKLLHASATRREGRLWRPKCRPITLEPCSFGAGKAWRNGMVHVVALWIAIPDATLHMDKTAECMKFALPRLKGLSDICCMCGWGAQVPSPM